MNFWPACFGIDLRSLALARIAIGFVVCFDFIFALSRRHFYYTEWSMFPREALLRFGAHDSTFSLYLLSSADAFTTSLLCLSVAVSFAFMLGWRCPWTSVLLWLAVYSLQERNPLILIGGDSWLRATLFWMMFLPVDRFYSWKTWMRGEESGTRIVCDAASMGLILQIIYIYFWSGLVKYGSDWRDGQAIYWVLEGQEFGHGLAPYLLHFPQVLKLISQTVPWLEILAGLALLLPFWIPYARKFTAGSLILLHCGIWLCMDLYHFSAIAIATLIILWPSRHWSLDSFHDSKLPKTLTALLLLTSFLTIIYNPIRLTSPSSITRETSTLANLLGFEQFWQLFAPMAPRETFIIYAVAETNQGEEHFLSLRGKKTIRPPGPKDKEKDVRLSRFWRSLLENPDNGASFWHYAKWYGLTWASLYPDDAEQLFSIKLYYQTYPTGLQFEDLPPSTPRLMAEYRRASEGTAETSGALPQRLVQPSPPQEAETIFEPPSEKSENGQP